MGGAIRYVTTQVTCFLMISAMKTKIHYTKPSITDLEVRYAADAAANGWGANCYDYIHRFEKEFALHLGVKHAIATSSCTGALHMGLAALGVGPGDEVIIADINWIASIAPVVHLGAKPVFVDVKFDSWCIDPEAAEAAITPRTKAIIAVHLYGNLCDMDALRTLSVKTGVPIVEDAAEAVGSVWHGARAGSMGEFGTFSFHGTKTITTGEGGMFVTNNSALFEQVRMLANHGRSATQTKQFWPDAVGFKYKMSNIQAAIGCAQLERVDNLMAEKRRVFERYAQAMSTLPVKMNPEPTGTLNGYWMPTIVVEQGTPFDRTKLIEAMQRENIDARVFFWPLSSLPMFTPVLGNTVSYDIFLRAMNLPSYHDLADQDIDRVCAVVADTFG